MWATLKAAAEPISLLTGALQSLGAFVGLIVGGVWTFRLFVKNRLNRPCATPVHQVTVRQMQGAGLLVHVGVEVKNESVVLMRIVSGEVRLVPLLPLSEAGEDALGTAKQPHRKTKAEAEVEWPGVMTCEFDWSEAPREIEPRESDIFHFDFVAPSDLQSFQIYSYLANPTKRRANLGWRTTTFHDIAE